MNIIFLSLMYIDKSISCIKKYSRCGLQMATHNFQQNLVNGFESNMNIDLSVISIPPVGSFPINYISPIIKTEHYDKAKLQIGFINLPYARHIIQKDGILKHLRRLIHKYGESETFIVAYSTYEPFLDIINTIKREYSSIKSCLVVTDCIPGVGDMERYMTPSAIKKGKRIIKKSRSIDSFAFLTRYLATALEVKDKPYVITECICNQNQAVSSINKKNYNRCLYTGSLNFEFGIKDFVDIFAEMDNCELWICGSGEAKEYVIEQASKHKNIKYLGFLNSQELEKVRNDCDFLINPRKPTGTYTKYSFPSKTSEYMMTGKPTVMYKLEGVPDEYDAYLNYIKSDKKDEIKKELEALFSTDYNLLVDKSLAGRKFMIENKTADKQSKKIIDLLKSL